MPLRHFMHQIFLRNPAFIEIPEVGVVKLFSQISYNGRRGTEAANDVLLNKASGLFFSYRSKSLSFHAPSKVFY